MRRKKGAVAMKQLLPSYSIYKSTSNYKVFLFPIPFFQKVSLTIILKQPVKLAIRCKHKSKPKQHTDSKEHKSV